MTAVELVQQVLQQVNKIDSPKRRVVRKPWDRYAAIQKLRRQQQRERVADDPKALGPYNKRLNERMGHHGYA